MSLSQALATAMSGLRANQAALALVSSNVANAETPGYVKKTLNTIATTTADYGSSVRINGVNRELDQFVQTQLRTETSGAAYADIRSSFLANLQGVYGDPDSTGTLESALNALTTAVQALRAGCSVTLYTKDLIQQTRSSRASGSWTPDSADALVARQRKLDTGFPHLAA